MSERLVILGSKGGPALRPGGPWPTSSLIEIGGRSIVVDCGLGVTRGLVDAGVSLKSLDLVFVTHLHSDHVLELGALIHTAWTAGLASVVRVFGPPGTARVWENFVRSLAFDIEIRIADEGRPDIRDLVTVKEFGEGVMLDEGGLTVSALRVDHPPVVDAFALKMSHGGRIIVFSGDTAFCPPLADFSRGADVLVHEAMLADGVDRLVARTGNGARLKQHLLASHTFADDAGRIAAAADVGLLVLNHLIPADDPDVTESDWISAVRKTFDGPLTIGRDGLVVPLQQQASKGEAA